MDVDLASHYLLNRTLIKMLVLEFMAVFHSRVKPTTKTLPRHLHVTAFLKHHMRDSVHEIRGSFNSGGKTLTGLD